MMDDLGNKAGVTVTGGNGLLLDVHGAAGATLDDPPLVLGPDEVGLEVMGQSLPQRVAPRLAQPPVRS